MDSKERDEILYRLDERTKRVDDHLARLDERLKNVEIDVEDHDYRINENEDDLEIITKTTKSIGGTAVAILSAIFAKLIGVLEV